MGTIRKYSKGTGLVVGNTYILRSNEPQEIRIAVFTGEELCKMPVFKDVDTGEEVFGGMIVIDYSEENMKLLEGLAFIEQWNYLAHNHCQISKKYGISYRTFVCKCEECTKLSI